MSASGEATNLPSNVLTNEDWVQRWDDGAIGFHKTTVNPLLEKHIGAMINGRSNIHIFFPMCGKALDMKWLAEQGHTVIGVEYAQKAVEAFFTENDIPHTTEPLPAIGGILYQSEDKKLQIYCCDIYKFSKDLAGQVDGIWDRGALVAINNQDREKFVSITKSLMAPGCKYLLSALQYDETKYGGPPHHLSDEAMQNLFSDCKLELLEDADGFEEKHRAWGLDSMREKIFLIQPK